MSDTHPSALRGPPLSGGPVRDSLFVMASIAPPLLAAAWWSATDAPWLAAGIATCLWTICTAWTVAGVARAHPHDRFGAGNVVTALRAAGVVLLATAIGQGDGTVLSGWVLPVAAAAILCLDGLDGALARRTGRTSRLGAAFDMEVDQALTACLAILIWQTQPVGAWVLLLAAPRYAFVVAGRVWPGLARPLPDSLMRKAVCVLQVGALCLMLVPGLPGGALTALASLAGAGLLWSFARDLAWLKAAQ